MIKKEDVISLLIDACPSFKEPLEKSDNEDLLYVVMGDLASHLLVLYRQKTTEEFASLCNVIERLHTDGDGYVRELAAIGFLEGIQNVWGNQGEDPNEFCQYLLPDSLKWWKELNEFWDGKISYVGEGMHNKEDTPDPKPVR